MASTTHRADASHPAISPDTPDTPDTPAPAPPASHPDGPTIAEEQRQRSDESEKTPAKAPEASSKQVAGVRPSLSEDEHKAPHK